jgi:hypothetical protein
VAQADVSVCTLTHVCKEHNTHADARGPSPVFGLVSLSLSLLDFMCGFFFPCFAFVLYFLKKDEV